MGKVFRAVYIAVPLALTIGAILSLVFVFVGGLDTKNATLNRNYFLRADTSNFTYGASTPTSALSALIGAQATNTKALVASDYFIYFSSYCASNITSTNADIYSDIYYCSPSARDFYFDPIAVWGLNNTGLDQEFPKELQDGINTYKKVAGWMYTAYMIAFWTLVVEAVVGLFAICSRLVSFLATLVASVAALFTFAASLTSTITFSVLAGAIKSSLKPYHVTATVGSGQLGATWLAVAFALGSMFFWTFSICCCSPHSRKRDDKPRSRGGFFNRGGERGRTLSRMGTGLMAERTGGYARVGSPYAGAQDGRARSVSPMPAKANEPFLESGYGHRRGASEGVPMTDMGAREKGAYEPFRHS